MAVRAEMLRVKRAKRAKSCLQTAGTRLGRAANAIKGGKESVRFMPERSRETARFAAGHHDMKLSQLLALCKWHKAGFVELNGNTSCYACYTCFFIFFRVSHTKGGSVARAMR